MPFRALMEADVAGMLRAWVVRIWAVLVGAQTLFFIAVSLDAPQAHEGLAGILGAWPLVWSTVIIVVAGGAIAAEAGVVADSVLSKAVTRWEYVLAKLSARLLVILGLYLLVAGPATYIVAKEASGDISQAGVVWAVALIGLALVMLTSLTVMFSTLFNRTLVAVVVMWSVWYVAGTITGLLEIEAVSPLRLVDRLDPMLQGDYKLADQWESAIGFTVISIAAALVAVTHFSRKDV